MIILQLCNVGQRFNHKNRGKMKQRCHWRLYTGYIIYIFQRFGGDLTFPDKVEIGFGSP